MHILTLNLWNINEPLHYRMVKLEEYLARTRPDIVTLQEISPIDGIPQSDQLAQRLGYVSHYTYSGSWQGREQGLVTLTLSDSHIEQVISLTEAPNDMARIAVATIIPSSPSSPELAVINTHLTYHIDHATFRLAQARECLRMATDAMHGRKRGIVLCGDFNESPDGLATEVIRTDTSLNLCDCWSACQPISEPGHTFARENPWADDNLWPGRRIDYIFISSQVLRPLSCNLVLTNGDGWGPVSDHYGVLAHVEAM